METLTKNAAVDSLSDQDYMDILEELLQTHTLRELVVVLQSQYSFGHWAGMRKGERAILRPGHVQRHWAACPWRPRGGRFGAGHRRIPATHPTAAARRGCGTDV